MSRLDKIVIGPEDALIVIDMTGDFCYLDGKLFVGGVKGEVEQQQLRVNIKQLLKRKFGWVMPTCDWHPKDHSEFAIYGEHSVAYTPGAEVIKEIKDEIFNHPGFQFLYKKGTDNRLIGYSVVYSDGYPQLISDLTHFGIKRVFICGLAYTHCVGESAIDFARQHSFEVFVVRDATMSVPPPYGNPELMDKKLECFGVKLVNTEDFAD